MCGETNEISGDIPVDLERCVNRLRNTNPEKFQELCKMHLSFLLDFPSIEEFLSDPFTNTTAEVTSKNKKLFTPFSKRKNKCLQNIGAALTENSINQIYQLVQYLGRPHNIKQEGLFRKTGHLNRQKVLKDRLYAGQPLQLDNGDFSAHDCANVLKCFLGDLSEPILKDRFYEAHCQVPAMLPENATTDDRFTPELIQLKVTKQLKTVQLLFHLLPAENSTVLECILKLLHKVAEEEENKMTAETLGTLFAPHILCPRKITANELHAASKNITRAMSFMIRHTPTLLQIPRDLAQDISTYWKQMEEEPVSRPSSRSSEDDPDLAVDTFGLRHQESVVINTCVQFVDRKGSQEASEKTDTEVALAQLYAYVQSLPESSKKRKLLKQFNKANNPYGAGLSTTNPSTPSSIKHKRTKSIGASLRKKFTKKREKVDFGTSTYRGFNLSNDYGLSNNSENMLNCSSISSDNILSSQSNDKVCIVDLNLSAPLLSPPDTRKRKPLEESVLNRLNEACEPPAKKERRFTDEVGKNIEALLSPIPHQSSLGRRNMLTPRCRVPIVMCHSPDLLNQETRCSPLKFSKLAWQ
ncbi:rho GTPase-activating protein 19-like isoform X2 [Lineus longissimus]|uniref:rho GTPase-activating protein 19-like isoform X2 n=1 Tax=Lineus longissimus TaxID=88925 RepID=UPI002B4CE27A